MMKKNRGFSVFELLVVIAVFGVVVYMTISLSPMLGLSSRLNKAVNRVISDINFAKQMASAENRYVVIDFSSDGTTYTIKKQKDISFFNPSLDDDSSWDTVRSFRPWGKEQFFRTAEVKDFAVNSIGEVREITNPGPTKISLKFFVKKNKWGYVSDENIALSKRVVIFPYGGVKVEK